MGTGVKCIPQKVLIVLYLQFNPDSVIFIESSMSHPISTSIIRHNVQLYDSSIYDIMPKLMTYQWMTCRIGRIQERYLRVTKGAVAVLTIRHATANEDRRVKTFCG